jgi:hypothetical protein
MADMEVPVGFRRKSRDDPAAVLAGRTVGCHELSNEIRRL